MSRYIKNRILFNISYPVRFLLLQTSTRCHPDRCKTDSTTQIISASQESKVTTQSRVLKKLDSWPRHILIFSKGKHHYHVHKNSRPQQFESSPHPWTMFFSLAIFRLTFYKHFTSLTYMLHVLLISFTYLLKI